MSDTRTADETAVPPDQWTRRWAPDGATAYARATLPMRPAAPRVDVVVRETRAPDGTTRTTVLAKGDALTCNSHWRVVTETLEPPVCRALAAALADAPATVATQQARRAAPSRLAAARATGAALLDARYPDPATPPPDLPAAIRQFGLACAAVTALHAGWTAQRALPAARVARTTATPGLGWSSDTPRLAPAALTRF